MPPALSGGPSPEIRLRAHYPRLDGLRGIAIAAVLVFHATPMPHTSSTVLRGLQAVARQGWIGVDLFFVLSGFLITGILLDTRDAAQRWRTFWWRRVLRIFPLYYAVLAGLVVFYSFRSAVGTWGTAWVAWCASYASDLTSLVRPEPKVPLAAQHFWSLAVEEQFYAVWPFVVWRTSRQQLVRVAVLLVALAVLVRLGLRVAYGPHAPYFVPFGRMDALLVGAMLAAWQREPNAWARVQRLATPVGAAAAVTVAALLALRAPGADEGAQFDPWVQLTGMTLIAVAAGAWVARSAAASASGWLARGPLPWLGRYAYGLYVYHMFVVAEIVWRLARNGWLGPVPDAAPWRGTLTSIAVAVGITVPIAVVSYHGFESRFLRLKRLFPTRVPARSGGTVDVGPRPAVVPEPTLATR